MKLGTVESVKFKKLMLRLRLPQYAAVGLLESIWMFTAREAQIGDIGRHSNEDIALSIGYPDDPDTLINTLVDCGWLDVSEQHRLVVHDWADHIPNWLKGNLSKHGREPVGGFARQPAKQLAEQDTKQTARQPAMQPARQPAINSIQSNPNQSNPTPPHSAGSPSDAAGARYPSSPHSADPQPAGAGWEEVEEGLRRLDVTLIQKAIESAKRHGFTAPQVLALIAYLDTNPQGCVSKKGAIFNRLVDQASDAVDWLANENWPWSEQPSSHSREGGNPANEAKAAQLAAQELDRLIFTHSDALKSMPDDEVQAMIGRMPMSRRREDLRRSYLARGRDSPDVKHELLRLIDQSVSKGSA